MKEHSKKLIATETYEICIKKFSYKRIFVKLPVFFYFRLCEVTNVPIVNYLFLST